MASVRTVSLLRERSLKTSSVTTELSSQWWTRRRSTSFAMQHGITFVDGDEHATQWVATTSRGVQKAIRKTRARKVITFHSRVTHAKQFVADAPRGIAPVILGLAEVGYVCGADPVAERKEVLAGFNTDQKRLVANARCLTEGVDLPAVDMVVFTNPRRSRVDIIQAVGRAMRKPRGGNKTFGLCCRPHLAPPRTRLTICKRHVNRRIGRTLWMCSPHYESTTRATATN